MKSSKSFEVSPASSLAGRDLGNGWIVGNLVTALPNATGGFFSVGYTVQHKNGLEGYLKALDYSKALQDSETPKQLEILAAAYNFECALLEKCRTRRLKRIVSPIEKGSVVVDGFGSYGKVDYIIFEKALSNMRDHYELQDVVDTAWALRIMHQSMVATRQLHSIEIAHQDIKPSNVLEFPDMGAKLSDLGRASDKNLPHANDELQVPGAQSYAPLEQFYGFRLFKDFRDRYLADLYQIGSLFFFHFLDFTSATQAIRAHLHMNPNLSGNSYEADLPYISAAFERAVADLAEELRKRVPRLAEDITQVVRELCDPDPRRRARQPFAQDNNFLVVTQRYISKLDVIAAKAEMGML